MIGLSLKTAILVHRGQDMTGPAAWTLTGDRFKSGVFSLGIYRGPHPDEPAMATLVLASEEISQGALVMLRLVAEAIATVQGPRRPVVDVLEYRLLHDGERVAEGAFLILPYDTAVDALKGIAA